MSDRNNTSNERLEGLLRKACLPDPSQQLKKRITTEAKKAWIQAAPDDVPWQIPIRRLAVSAAAAILVVWLANYSSDYMLTRHKIWNLTTTDRVSDQNDIDGLPEMPYGRFARRLVSIQLRQTVFDASALNNRDEAFRRILDEALQSTFSQTPREGPQSRLSPNWPFDDLYS